MPVGAGEEAAEVGDPLLLGLLADGVDRVGAEHAVAFELRLAEPLVARGLVRKSLVERLVVEDVARLAAADGGLEIKDLPDPGVRSVDGTVIARADRAV